MIPSRRSLARAQANFYLISGAWPLLSRRTFEKLTGPKQDFWLAQTVGALIVVTGATLIAAAEDQRTLNSTAVRTLAIGSALSLAAVDVVFVARRRISPIYLADAAAELALAAGWLISRPSRPKNLPTDSLTA